MRMRETDADAETETVDEKRREKRDEGFSVRYTVCMKDAMCVCYEIECVCVCRRGSDGWIDGWTGL